MSTRGLEKGSTETYYQGKDLQKGKQTEGTLPGGETQGQSLGIAHPEESPSSRLAGVGLRAKTKGCRRGKMRTTRGQPPVGTSRAGVMVKCTSEGPVRR